MGNTRKLLRIFTPSLRGIRTQVLIFQSDFISNSIAPLKRSMSQPVGACLYARGLSELLTIKAEGAFHQFPWSAPFTCQTGRCTGVLTATRA